MYYTLLQYLGIMYNNPPEISNEPLIIFIRNKGFIPFRLSHLTKLGKFKIPRKKNVFQSCSLAVCLTSRLINGDRILRYSPKLT